MFLWNFGFDRTDFHELTGIHKAGYEPPPQVGLNKASDIYSCAMIFLALAVAATEVPSPSGEDSDDSDMEPDERALNAEKFAAGAASWYTFRKLSTDFLRSATYPDVRSFPEMPAAIGQAGRFTKKQWGQLWQLIIDMAKSGSGPAVLCMSMQDVLDRLRHIFAPSIG